MKARIRLLGHPVHQMLIVFPLGLLATSIAFDIVGLVSAVDAAHTAAYWTLTAGIAGAAVAAPFGYLDWTAIPRGTRARRVGAMHGMGNVAVTALFIASWLLRSPAQEPPLSSLACAWIATAAAMATAWLGAELVCRHAMGVDEDAGLDAGRRAQAVPSGKSSP